MESNVSKENRDEIEFPNASGEAADLPRKLDWTESPLRPPRGASPARGTRDGLVFASRQPMILVRRRARAPLCNDAGAIAGLVAGAEGIARGRVAEMHGGLPADERDHRLDDTRSAVEGAARQTFRDGAGIEGVMATCFSRRSAPSAAHTPAKREKTALAEPTRRMAEACGHAGRVPLSGPPPNPPARKGFGPRLIEPAPARNFGGAATLTCRAAWLACPVRGWRGEPRVKGNAA